MEFEFDKEMDSILHQAAKGDILFPEQDANAEHIDADEISVFAENALPEKAKPRVMKHLADCGECRIILSNVISLNAEDKKAANSINRLNEKTVVESSETSWFQKLFSTRNLAFGMGSLALIFAVGIGFILVQNLYNENGEMAKASSSQSDKMSLESTTQNPLDTANNTPLDSDETEGLDSKTEAKNDEVFDSKDDQSETPSEDLARSDNSADKKTSDLKKKEQSRNKTSAKRNSSPQGLGNLTEEVTSDEDFSDEKEASEADISSESRIAPAPRVSQSRTASPVREKQDDAGNKISEKKKAKRKLRARKSKASPKRQLGNKTFTSKNGIWTDSAYKGQKTTGIKRGTSQYSKLDSGLKSIANKLGGTVVIIWKSKAYKIQ